jgi:hypothetical protein
MAFLDAKRVLLALWASRLHVIGYRSIPDKTRFVDFRNTRPVELTIRKRMVPRSPSRALPTLEVAGGKECGAAGNGKESLRPSAGGGYSVVSILSP